MLKGTYMKKIIILIIFSLAIEVFVFNLPNIISIISDESYSLELNSRLIPNEDYDGTNIQWLIDLQGEKKIYNIVIVTSEPCSPSFYYTDSKGVIQMIPFIKEGKTYIATINRRVSGYIGISTYNSASVSEAIINASAISFSLSRVIAMLIIYVAGVLLFSIQKMPDYQLD